MEKPKIIAVVGPTASGKTALAVALAQRLGGEVISCDSMQVYRGMNIGTAKPNQAEMQNVPHHLLDIADPADVFSVADYVNAANTAVQEILVRGNLPIFCGGTGLYLDAFLRGGLPETPAADLQLRARLIESASDDGGAALYAELTACDPESAASIHPNNLRRVMRALEVFRLSGIPKSEWDRRSATLPRLYDATVIGLRFEDRELLYRRIDARVDAMIRAGLVEETRELAACGVFAVSHTAAAAIGYKELLPYLAGECDLPFAVAQIKTATRRYAKRQMTWFAAKEYVTWLFADACGSPRKFEEIVNNALDLCD